MSFAGIKLRGKFLTTVVITVAILIIADVFITRNNNRIIDSNQRLQKQAEQVKENVSGFAILIIHNLDLGLRSYALFGKEKYLYPLNVALRDKDSIYMAVEKTLAGQHYPLEEFHQLRDSINAYAAFCVHLKALYDQNKREEFFRLGDMDKGYHLWLQYEVFARKVYAFEDRINELASRNYHAAVNRNYLVQVILFFVCVPALLVMAQHTLKKFAIAEDLRKLDIEKAEILKEQNIKLEEMVHIRTQEIQMRNQELQNKNNEITAQNEELTTQQEEITAQRDLLAQQNEKINESKAIIELKSTAIEAQNNILEQQVEERTKELLEHSNQLEQFTFMAAHNLRAPVARILGLSRILKINQAYDEGQFRDIIDKINTATHDLDLIVRDLGRILEVRSAGNRVTTQVELTKAYEVVKFKLLKEILESNAVLIADFSEVPLLTTVKSYFESILYNLVHNAIKFRHPARIPSIAIKTVMEDCQICLIISDNGIGLNMDMHRDELFHFHKRFHTHVDGRGIGLYLANIQAHAMGGRIEFESKVDIGTTVKVFLKSLP